MNQPILPPLEAIPPQLTCVADYESFARQRISTEAWAYLNGAAADGLTFHNNQAAFRKIQLNGRVLADMRAAHTRLSLLGEPYEHPILLAPVAYHRLAHADGELATVLGAGASSTGMIVSTQASTDLNLIAQQAHSPLWFQLYLQSERALTIKLLERAHLAGYRALVVTLDAPVSGIRNDEQRAGFRLPPGITAVNLQNTQHTANHAPANGSGSGPLFGSGLLAGSAQWHDLEWLLAESPLPVLAKGIMHPDDARRLQDLGVAGLIVSNHGGRTLDGLPATITALPGIVDAVGRHFPVLLDGGIRRGSDVFKALALGAHAVLIGRPYIYGLATAGAAGVAHVVQLLRAELEVSMCLTGCAQLGDIGPAALWPVSMS